MLASRTVHANARAAHFVLPFHLRLLSHRQSTRSFSASPSFKIDLTTLVANPPLAVLSGLHTVGLPWYAAIPAAAVLIRGVFGYYFASVPARRRQQIRSNLNPLIAAGTSHELQLNPTGARTNLEKLISGPIMRRKVYPYVAGMMTSHKYGKKFGAGVVAPTSFVNFLSLIATAEAVRMLCGTREGLLSTLLTPFTWLGRILAPEYFPAGINPVDAVADAYVNRVEQIRQARLQSLQENGADDGIDLDTLSGNVLQASQPLPSQLVNTSAPHFDPSLHTEGLSWCTDLTVMDPTFMLPALTFAAMAGNILANPQPITRPTSLPNWMPLKFLVQRYSSGQRFAVAIAGGICYMLQDVPAAIVLYVFSSVVTGFLQKKCLDFTMPLRSPIMPCVRRIRVRSKKQFNVRQ